MSQLGFKKLTIDNWLESDEVLSVFVQLSADGQIQSISGNEWAERILEPKLTGAVPNEIRRLFEVARGAMLYGYFFYPLYTLGNEQLYRVAEAAVRHVFKTKGGPRKKKPFKERLDWLVRKNIISEWESSKWNVLRRLRNMGSHPEDQRIYTPSMAIQTLENFALDLNSLFQGDT